MISDTLFDAVEEIDRYLLDLPFIYNAENFDCMDEINKIKFLATRLMRYLDLSPSCPAETWDSFIKTYDEKTWGDRGYKAK